jgi:hypothetical protein
MAPGALGTLGALMNVFEKPGMVESWSILLTASWVLALVGDGKNIEAKIADKINPLMINR